MIKEFCPTIAEAEFFDFWSVNYLVGFLMVNAGQYFAWRPIKTMWTDINWIFSGWDYVYL